MYLSLADYESREQIAADELPNRVVEMVNPVVFASEGYPMRVRNEKVLWRYLDVMHETRFEQDFALLHDGGFTDEEFSYVKHIATLVCDFAKKNFGRPLTTYASLSRALHVFRSISDLVENRTLKAFEIGPGCGYLGCLFVHRGWGYAATDITQAFYLLQNRLWNDLTGGKLVDLAGEHKTWSGELTAGVPVHIPWWEFFRLIQNQVPKVDVVTCNHALAEMHPNSLSFTLRLAHEMLQGKGPKLFVFEGWGFEKLMGRNKVLEQFIRFGFNLVHTDNRVTVLAPVESLRSGEGGILPNGSIQKHIQADNSLYLPGNSLTPRLAKARHNRTAHISAKPEHVFEFYRQLTGQQDFRTEDEKFLELIGRNYR